MCIYLSAAFLFRIRVVLYLVLTLFHFYFLKLKSANKLCPFFCVRFVKKCFSFQQSTLLSQMVIRPMMYIALTYDHRLVDGREAVTFLKTIKQGVEDPRSMFMGL